MINTSIHIDTINKIYGVNMIKYLDIQITESNEKYICGTMPVNQKTMQPGGILHGGASAVLAETLGNIGADLCVDDEIYRCVGMNINTNHIKTASQGLLHGKATFIHLGRSSHIWEIKILDDKKQLISINRFIAAVLHKKKPFSSI